ncbi:DegV family protein [Deinococcus peraridilitoris]|uniref:EDD domain protein, DegV family n=1 Tax=Deinococcus peraridilitoris (strain DSM 19664 / LMG 22246 / CIP 109416 / KR-200) TaxID=937777 RepID=L0A7E9_DEIPD|nr:EDD domain protein, DegV family [Deinococcus peraridilitoris DSM 19664]
MIAIVTDSTSDLLPQHLSEWNLKSVPLYVLFDGNMLKDGVEITPSQIFKGVREGKKPPSTSQPSPAEFADAYRAALTSADHVLSIHISSELSGTSSSARLAAQEFPGQVTVVDSRSVSGGLALQVLRAARLAREGAQTSDIVAQLERIQRVMTLRFTVDTLDFLRLNGRIGGAQALLGSLLNIKPILQVKEGKVDAAGRVRGQKKAVAEIVNSIKAYTEQHGPSRALLLVTEGGEGAVQEIRAGMRGLQVEDVGTVSIGAVVATHAGPGAMGIALEPVTV